MEREIEFRGQRADNKEWVYGDLVRIPNGDSFDCYIISDFDERDSIYDLGKYAIKVIPETVGQYVGIKDKNGKKIFEHDIVKGYLGYGDNKNNIAYIEYQEDNIAFGLLNILEKDRWKCFEISDKMEVIGNIFKNFGYNE